MKARTILMRITAFLLALLFPLISLGEREEPLAEGAELRIMSFNLMHPDWSRIPVKGRDEKAAAILLANMPDVAALQEAGAKWHKALIPLLVESGHYAQACRKSNAEGFIYCCTTFLYNPRTLRLVDEYILDLDPRDAARVLSVAVFERLSDHARFVVTNTHPAPREDPEKHARNMRDLITLASGETEKYASLPCILAGDFNTPEEDGMYEEFMEKTGTRDAKYEATVLARDCSTYFGDRGEPDPESREFRVDHLFVNDRVGVKLFNIIIGHDIRSVSDHTPIYADISLK